MYVTRAYVQTPRASAVRLPSFLGASKPVQLQCVSLLIAVMSHACGGGLITVKQTAILLVTAAAACFGCTKSVGPAPPTPVSKSKSNTPRSVDAAPGNEVSSAGPATDSGLSAAEREDFYHTPEGSALFPLDWLRALRDKNTGKPFLENPQRFGLLPDPNHPLKLPVGLAPEVPRGTSAFGQWVGINCTACHVGELTYQGNSYRIDGGPNLFNLDHFYRQLFDSLTVTVQDPDKMLAFLTDLLSLDESYLDEPANKSRKEALSVFVSAWTKIRQLGGDELTDIDKAFLARIKSFLGDVPDEAKSDDELHQLVAGVKGEPSSLDKLKAQVTAPFQAGVADLRNSLSSAESRVGGPLEKVLGLDDAALNYHLTDFVANLGLFKARLRFLSTLKQVNENQPAPPGPGRIDAFMNARNLVFGVDNYEPPTSPVSYPYIWGIAWFGMFHYDGNTNSFMERNTGQALGLGAIFNRDTWESTVRPRDLHTLEGYARKLNGPAWPFGAIDSAKATRGAELYQEHCATCHATERTSESTKDFTWDEIKTDQLRLINVAKKVENQPYYTKLDTALKAIKKQAYIDNHISPEEAADFEGHVQEVFKQTDKLIARPLVSVWASPPFLHNGSVPRLYDLLLTKQQRPPQFYLGHREYDPEKLGYVLNTSEGDAEALFLFDTTKLGNDNGGHEFGTDLSEADRMALLEYLKSI